MNPEPPEGFTFLMTWDAGDYRGVCRPKLPHIDDIAREIALEQGRKAEDVRCQWECASEKSFHVFVRKSLPSDASVLGSSYDLKSVDASVETGLPSPADWAGACGHHQPCPSTGTH